MGFGFAGIPRRSQGSNDPRWATAAKLSPSMNNPFIQAQAMQTAGVNPAQQAPQSTGLSNILMQYMARMGQNRGWFQPSQTIAATGFSGSIANKFFNRGPRSSGITDGLANRLPQIAASNQDGTTFSPSKGYSYLNNNPFGSRRRYGF